MSSDRCRHFIPALLHSGNDRSIQVWNGSVWSFMHDMCNVGIYTPGVSQPSLSPSPGALCTPIACYILILLIQCSPFYAHVTSLCIAFAIMTPHLPTRWLLQHHSIEVYASNSLPLRLRLSIGSSFTSIPGPIGLDPLCAGNTCKSNRQHFVPAAQLHSPPSLSRLSMAKTHPRPTPPQPKRRLMRKQLAKPQHQAIDKRQEYVDRGSS